MVEDSVRCVEAGAAELHIHPRDGEGRESLAAVDALMEPLRRRCPGTLVGVSTGAWIENDIDKTRTCIANWKALPDYALVNISEPDAPAIIALLSQMGVGVEAGLASVDDARRFTSLPQSRRVLRILIELEEQDTARADVVAAGIADVMDEAGIARPVLLHGFDATVWHFVRRARQRRWSTRIGLEDGCHLPDGMLAGGNVDLVSAALRIFSSFAD